MVSSTLWFSLLPLLACGLATVCWFLIRRRQALTSGAAPRQEESIRLDLLVVLLCFFSIFLLPVRFRNRLPDHPRYRRAAYVECCQNAGR